MSKQNSTAKAALKLNYKQIFLIGFGFLASSLAWSIYNSQVPLILEQRFQLSGVLIGTIMTIDNFFGVIFQPLVGAASDKTRTRIGRRMPWIIVGIPVCALFFSLAPLQQTLWAFMGAIIIFNLVMSLWRSPVISLMPDVTARPLRSKANGVINLMGGLGSIVAFFVGGKLSQLDPSNEAAFLMGALVMIASLIMLIFFVKEPTALPRGAGKDPLALAKWQDERRMRIDEQRRIKAEVKQNSAHLSRWQVLKQELFALSSAELRSLIFILLAIFFWFCAYNAIETFFTLYAVNVLGISAGEGAQMLTVFSLTFVAFAIPAGLIGSKLGRKRTILIGLAGITTAFIPVLFLENKMILTVLLSLGGLFWACVNINSLPMVVELATKDKVGSFTGYYYFFSFSAAILAPITFGLIRDLSNNYSLLFAFSSIAFILAFVCMLFVKHGEVKEANPAEDEVLAE